MAGVAVAAAVTSVADFQGAKPEIRQRPAASFVLRGTRGTPQVTAPRDCATGWQNVEFSAELKYTMWRSRLDVLLAAGMETRPNAELFSEEPIQALFRAHAQAGSPHYGWTTVRWATDDSCDAVRGSGDGSLFCGR